MEKSEIKKAMTNIFDCLLADSKAEAKSNPLFKFIESNKDWLGDPEEFNVMINHKYRNIIGQCVEGTYKSDNNTIKLIYNYWNIFENNINKITRKLEGMCCSSDRTRKIIKSYIEYSLTGELPKWEESYSVPKIGNAEDWMDLIDGIAGLIYGNNENYLSAYMRLISYR